MAKTNNKPNIMIIVIIIITIMVLISIIIPSYTLERGVLQRGEDKYVLNNYRWGAIEKGGLVGRVGFALLGQVWSVKGDDERLTLWYYSPISEFGGQLYFKNDFRLPEFSDIEPNRIVLGSYSSFYKIENDVYAYSEDSEVLDIYEKIIKEGKTYKKQYTKNEMAMIENALIKMPWLSLFTNQVHGSAYTMSLSFEDGICYLINDNNEKAYDVTYVIYKIVSEGTIVDKERLKQLKERNGIEIDELTENERFKQLERSNITLSDVSIIPRLATYNEFVDEFGKSATISKGYDYYTLNIYILSDGGILKVVTHDLLQNGYFFGYVVYDDRIILLTENEHDLMVIESKESITDYVYYSKIIK